MSLGPRAQTLRNAAPAEHAADLEAASPAAAAPRTPFEPLYHALVARLDHPATLLLLYHLLVHCPAFSSWVLVRADVDALLVPLLRQLYEASGEERHRVYLLQARTD